jgi:SAM-dependent methyltransferase
MALGRRSEQCQGTAYRAIHLSEFAFKPERPLQNQFAPYDFEMSSSIRAGLAKHRGDYGLDGGRTAVAGLVAIGATGLVLACLALIHARSGHIVLAVFELLAGLALLQTIPSYLYSTRRGKFRVWAELLGHLPLRGDEHALDMGCGRGAILTMLAKTLPEGRAVGLDLWRPQDQSGNSPEATRRNLDAEYVRNRCELVTADMRAVPFADSTFDLVVSSLSIHNIQGRPGKGQAIDEAVRVLKPGGRLLIADLMWTGAYVRRLRKLSMENVVEQRLKWPFCFGALGMATGLATATKPVGLR